MAWTSNVPTSTNQIGTDVDYIRNNFSYLYDLLTVHEIWVPSTSIFVGGTSGATQVTTEYSDYYVPVYVYSFGASNLNYATFQVVMPPNWNLGTVKAKFYWIPVVSGPTAGETVVWGIQATAASDGETIDAAWGTAQEVTDTVLADGTSKYLHVTTATAAVTVAGTPALGDLVKFRVYRDPTDANDNVDEAIYLLGVMLQITVNTSVTAW